MANVTTKLGDREIGKSREYISALIAKIPKKYKEYNALRKLADAEENEDVKLLLTNSSADVFNAFNSLRTELGTRLLEAATEVMKNVDESEEFFTPFLPYFATQQEMVEAKAK